MVDVRRCKSLAQAVLVPPSVPFAVNPADAFEVVGCRERLHDHVLSSFAVELQQIDFLDIKLGEACPQLLSRHRRHGDAEVAVAGSRSFHNL